MLVALLVALLAFAGDAHAQVFVRADPRAGAARHHHYSPCVDAAGDVVAAADGGGVRISEAGGPWRRLPGFAGCPEVAVAADGTAVVSASAELGRALAVVRPPGGRFGAPITVGRRVSVTPAAALGGWVALAWTKLVPEEDDARVEAMVIGPGGVARRHVLERAAKPGPLDDPTEVGIDASGRATVAWASEGGGFRQLRTASSAPGGASWTKAVDLPSGRTPYGVYIGAALDLVVAPDGRRLFAWANKAGVFAALDAERPRLISAAQGASMPVAALGDDGTALLGFGALDGRVFVAERQRGGDWATPRRMPGRAYASREESVDEVREFELAVAIAADGTATAVWTGSSEGRNRLRAASGRIGGPWSAPLTLASPLRVLGDWMFDGSRVVWTETVTRVTRPRVRGARLVVGPEAPPPDRTAPVVTAPLPSRVPPTRTGDIRIRVPVRCSEICDVRLTLELPESASFAESAVVVRELPADRTVTLTLRPDELFAPYFLGHRRYRRPRLELEVFDDAANGVRRTRHVRVPVIERPVRSFKVGPGHNFGMSTRVGDRAVGRLVNALIEGLASGSIDSEREVKRRYTAGARAIERAGHGKLDDVEVHLEVLWALMVPCLRAGYDDSCAEV